MAFIMWTAGQPFPVLIETCVHSSAPILSSTSMGVVNNFTIKNFTNHALRRGHASTVLLVEIILTRFNIIRCMDHFTPCNNQKLSWLRFRLGVRKERKKFAF
jgi:hypothetical protein